MAFKECLGSEKRALAAFLYGEKKYTMEEIATRLNMSKSSVCRIVHASRNDKQKREGAKWLSQSGSAQKVERATETKFAESNNSLTEK